MIPEWIRGSVAVIGLLFAAWALIAFLFRRNLQSRWLRFLVPAFVYGLAVLGVVNTALGSNPIVLWPEGPERIGQLTTLIQGRLSGRH